MTYDEYLEKELKLATERMINEPQSDQRAYLQEVTRLAAQLVAEREEKRITLEAWRNRL